MRDRKKSFEYMDIVRSVMNDVANDKCLRKSAPIKKDYKMAVAKKLTEMKYGEFTYEDVHSSVSRNIDRLVENGEMVKCVYGRTKYFWPLQVYSKVMIRESVDFARSDILVVSDCMCAVKVTSDTKKAKALFADYLGNDCFSISRNNDTLLIMIKCSDDIGVYDKTKEKAIIEEISSLVRASYEMRNKPKRIKLKKKVQETSATEKTTVESVD